MFNDDNKHSCMVNRHADSMRLTIYPNDPLQLFSNSLTPLIKLTLSDIGIKNNNTKLTDIDPSAYLHANVERCEIRGEDVMCISKEVKMYYYFSDDECPHKNLPNKTIFLTPLTFMRGLSRMITVDIAIRPCTPEESMQEMPVAFDSKGNIDSNGIPPYYMKTTAHVNMS